jgi:thiol-disulfide isomerase/thioredoxin
MVSRSAFMLGVIAACVAPPYETRAAKPCRDDEPHVHGANGLVALPEHGPVEWTSGALDGPDFRLSGYRGKAVFVNVFATWCGSCRSEQPNVVAFAAAHARDTVVVGMDVSEDDAAVRVYRETFGISYPIAMDRDDRTQRSIYNDGKLAFPATVVFRPDGALSCAWVGDRSRAWFERERVYALGPRQPVADARLVARARSAPTTAPTIVKPMIP